MPTNLHRYYGAGYSHFITTSCYQRRPLLGAPRSRDLFLEVMEQIRQRHQFVVVGYVVMPEHVHLLVSEPELTPVAVGHIWQRRFYDFVVFAEKKRVEKLRYMHRNPVQRGLVLKPEEWVMEQLPTLRLWRTRLGSSQRDPRSGASNPQNLLIPSASRPTRETATGGASNSR